MKRAENNGATCLECNVDRMFIGGAGVVIAPVGQEGRAVESTCCSHVTRDSGILLLNYL